MYTTVTREYVANVLLYEGRWGIRARAKKSTNVYGEVNIIQYITVAMYKQYKAQYTDGTKPYSICKNAPINNLLFFFQ